MMLVIIVCGAHASEPEYSSEAIEDVIVINGRYYQHVTDEPAGTRHVLRGGTWEYAGQQEFLIADPLEEPPIDSVGLPDAVSEPWSVAETRSQMTRLDARGRRWRWIGPGAGGSRLELGETVIEPAVEMENPGGFVPDRHSDVLHSQSWSTTDCDLGKEPFPVAQHSIFGPEDRFAATFGFRAQRANVYIERFVPVFGPGGNLVSFSDGRCSGTMVADDYLITAAHCVHSRFGQPIAPYNLVVCSRGNMSSQSNCSIATSISSNPGYNSYGSSFQPNQDYAVVHLSSPIVGQADTMGLSSTSPTTWDNFYTRSAGYPAFQTGLVGGEPNCDDNWFSNSTIQQISTGVSTPYTTLDDIWGATQYVSTRFELDWSSNRIKTKLDGGAGMSGAAFFYCPSSENCNATPYVIGLWTHWNSFSKRHLGPRVERFKQFVEDNEP